MFRCVMSTRDVQQYDVCVCVFKAERIGRDQHQSLHAQRSRRRFEQAESQ